MKRVGNKAVIVTGAARLSLLNNLSAIEAMLLRNAILYEKQERLILERTSELRYNKEKLAMELSERKRAEEAFTQSISLLKATLESTADGILVVGRAGRIIDFNERFLELWHIPMNVIVAQDDDMALAYVLDQLKNPDEFIAKVRELYGQPEEESLDVLYFKDGRVFERYSRPQRVGNHVTGRVWSFRDITERKRAEEALRESEEKYRTIFQNSPLGIFRSSFEGRFLDVNPATAKILGYDSPEAVIREIYNISEQIYVHTGDRQRIVSEQLGSADITTHYVNRFRRKDGSEFIANLYLKTIHDAEVRPIYLQGIVEDITERKRAERDIALMSFALNNVHEAAFLIDENAHFNYVNEYVCRALGYGRDELLGLGVPDVDPDFPAGLWPSHWDDLKTRGSLTFEGRHRAKDGSIFPVEVNANYFEYDGKGYSLALVRDITGRMRAEEERLANLRFLESMDRINRAIQGTNDLEQMMSDVLDTVLSIFNCDRAFMLYPCDPEVVSWRVPMERTRPEYPGAYALGLEVPIDPDNIRNFKILRATSGPVTFGPGFDLPLPTIVAERFSFRSMIAMAIYPKGDKPYMFGLHQCTYPRVWTPDERTLLQEIGHRLSDGLTSLLAYRNLQESEAKYRRIVDTASEGIWVVGPDIRTISVNAKMAEMLGYSGEEMIGRPFADFIFEEDVPDHLNKIENRRQVISEDYECQFRRKDGEALWTQVSATPILDDEHQFKGSFAMFTDITDRKRAEEDLFRLNTELEERVESRTHDLEVKRIELEESQQALINIVEDLNEKTVELEQANSRLQELERLKSMFIASMSHELRTPLNSVIGFSSVLLNEWVGPINAEQKENLAIILRSGKHLLSLINDVIDVSKIEAGKIEPVPDEFDLHDLVFEAVSLVKKELEEKGLVLRVTSPSQLMFTDRRRLLQCVLNLLSNAVKFTEQGDVTMETRIERSPGATPESGFAEISVTDTGIGIREEDIGKMFQPFERLFSPLQSTVPGTGLGLYLTRKLTAEVLKGDILLTSEYGKGSQFTIRIPVRMP
jgi:PAS domain S-box-containing protein